MLSGGAVGANAFPTMTSTVHALVDELGTASCWTTIGDTAKGWAVGLAVGGGGAAILLGSLIGLSPLAHRSAAPVIEFLEAVPSILRISAAVALILEIVAELIGGAPGLGQRLPRPLPRA